MLRNALAALMAVLIVLPLQGGPQTSPTVQEQVGQIAKGSIIEVKMKLKERKKVTGRLGEVTAEGFAVQVAQGQKVNDLKLRFEDVKSVKEKHGMSPLTKGLIVAGVAVGALALLGGILAATVGGN